MFTLPPRPPKDYYIANVTSNQRSSLQFTPNALPRVTQTSLAKYCAPIEYQDDEAPEKRPPDPMEPVIMDKMVHDARATWVVEPARDAFLIQDVYRNYATVERAADLDPRYKHKERVFNRSYKYELDCTEAVRLDKLRDKCEYENSEFEGAFEKIMNKQKDKEKPVIKLTPCKEGPPFWWKGEVPGEDKDSAPAVQEDVPSKRATVSGDLPFVRWHEEPNLAACIQDDPCQRKYDLLSVGIPYKTSACNYYYKNYPAAVLTIIPKKFA